ncbi:MAG: ferritin-like domain-containing protein [Acidimicrobiales bacterium]
MTGRTVPPGGAGAPGGRRRFLYAAGCAAGAGLLAACGGGGDEPRSDDGPVVTRSENLEGDLAVAALFVSLENLLDSVYQEGFDQGDRLGLIPPAVMTLLQTAQRQHKEHAAAWNSILTGAGKPGITGVNVNVKSTVSDPGLFRMGDATGFLALGHELETITASTYLAGIGAIENNAALKIAASIHIVENQHISAIEFLLGRTPAPESFGRTDRGRPTTDSIG